VADMEGELLTEGALPHPDRPKVPSEGLGSFAAREPRLIVLTNRHHYRHS
jgi:hypothetical protein